MLNESKEESMYLVLDETERERFVQAATDLGLVRHSVWEPAGPRDAYEEVWATPDQTRAVHYVEEPILKMPFVWIRGTNITPLAADLADKVSLFWPEELVERAYTANDHNEQVDNLYRLAITFPKYDPEVFKIFARYASQAPNPLLRRAALDAMSYRAWPEFRPILERVLREDGVEEVKRHATDLLTVWDKQAADALQNRDEGKN